MAEKHSSPDWIARLGALVAVVGTVVGIVLSILSLRLGYSNSHWQKEIQEETTAERILVHLDATRFANGLSSAAMTPNGEVGMEVVNIGLRPLFIKRAEMRIRGRTLTFYEHDLVPILPSEPMKSLGPSETIRYRLGWDFEKREEMEEPRSKLEDGTYVWLPASQIEDIEEVQVQTTKKTFVFQHQIVNVTLLAKVHEGRKSTSK